MHINQSEVQLLTCRFKKVYFSFCIRQR